MVPLCTLFSRKWGITGIWAGYAAADIINFIVVIIVAGWFRRKVIEKWQKTPTES
jgi:Na+-driven multidrug efflux pump